MIDSKSLQNITLGQNIRYVVNFPLQHRIPKLTKILYNGQLICSGPAEQSLNNHVVTTIDLEHSLMTTVGLQGPPKPSVSSPTTDRPFNIMIRRPSTPVTTVKTETHTER